jgi:3-oxoacyl-[acyl-carrier-protein] synthase III
MGSVITGTGVAVPPNVVDNEALARIMDTSDEWIAGRSGVRTRRFVDPGTTTSDLAVEAARMAMDDAGIGTVDAVVTATMTPDHQAPGWGRWRPSICASSAVVSSTRSTWPTV